MRFTITGCKASSTELILSILEREGFNLRAGIGYEWNGDDCTFTQPPDHPSESCHMCGTSANPANPR
jgi:hypothetical protein